MNGLNRYFLFIFRVADYGYTKLKDLFEALPHVVQIIGEGSRAMITLYVLITCFHESWILYL